MGTPRADRAAQARTIIDRLAEATGAPVIADPLSGCRFHPRAAEHVVGGYDLFLRDSSVRDRVRPDAVLRIGAVPCERHAQHAVVEALVDEPCAGRPHESGGQGGQPDTTLLHGETTAFKIECFL
jgi:2-succinyl-5-enolpyruvyl-6-hydroxy-3-cyclohexene-1-carboxylate synthase